MEKFYWCCIRRELRVEDKRRDVERWNATVSLNVQPAARDDQKAPQRGGGSISD
jgi:hypothetical protein